MTLAGFPSPPTRCKCAVALAAPLLGERVSRGRIAGAALVVTGVVALGSQ